MDKEIEMENSQQHTNGEYNVGPLAFPEIMYTLLHISGMKWDRKVPMCVSAVYSTQHLYLPYCRGPPVGP